MSKKIEFDANEGKFKTLRISSLDEEEDDEAQVNEIDDPDLYNDEDEDDEERVLVTLGFVEKPKNKGSLLHHYFPSKAGGTSAWLDPINLPSEKANLCDFCSEPLQFLLQHEQCKRHPEKPCRSVKVFRCQLPCTNLFYSSDAPREDGIEQPLTAGGDKVCSNCREARYCSGKHQAAHWRSGHRIGCTQLHTSLEMSESAASNSLWPQYMITNEDECEFEHEMSDSEHSNALVSGNRVDESVKSLMDDFAGDDDKRSWASFQEIISRFPEQLLRYCRSAIAKDCGRCTVVSHQDLIFLHATTVVALEVLSFRFCRSYFITLGCRMMWILLTGLKLLFTRARLHVKEMRVTMKNSPGFNLRPNQHLKDKNSCRKYRI